MALTSTTTNKLEFLLTLNRGDEATTRKLSFDDPNIGEGGMSAAEFEAGAISLARLLVSSDSVGGTITGGTMPTWNNVFQPTPWRDSADDSVETPWTTTKCDYQVVSTTTTRWTED